MINTEQIVLELKSTKKYKNVCDETLNRVVEWSVSRYKGEKNIVKASKQKLHQIYGAYFNSKDINKIKSLIENVNSENLIQICNEILKYHVSTNERIKIFSDFYSKFFDKYGEPNSILDLACGLNPFTYPLINSEKNIIYYACDIDCETISLINQLFSKINSKNKAFCKDILVSIPEINTDVTLIFKSLPCLEQQEKDISSKLIQKIKSKFIVISFPTKSIGNKEKGMKNFYSEFIMKNLSNINILDTFEFENEIFFIIKKV